MDDSFIKGEVVPVPLKDADLTIPQGNVKRELPVYLEADFIDSVIERMPPGVHRMLITFLWMTGVRVSEALAVRVRDLDFANFTARIRWLKSRRWNERVIPIHPDLAAVLRFYAAAMRADDLLFPISRVRAFQVCKRWLGVSPHKLRHSFAVHYLRSGGRIEDLRRLLGHSSLRVTMVYLRIVPSDLAVELRKIKF